MEECAESTNYYPLKKFTDQPADTTALGVWSCSGSCVLAVLRRVGISPAFKELIAWVSYPGKDLMNSLMVASSAKVVLPLYSLALSVSVMVLFFGGVGVISHLNYSPINTYIQIFLPVGREVGWHNWGLFLAWVPGQ